MIRKNLKNFFYCASSLRLPGVYKACWLSVFLYPAFVFLVFLGIGGRTSAQTLSHINLDSDGRKVYIYYKIKTKAPQNIQVTFVGEQMGRIFPISLAGDLWDVAGRGQKLITWDAYKDNGLFSDMMVAELTLTPSRSGKQPAPDLGSTDFQGELSNTGKKSNLGALGLTLILPGSGQLYLTDGKKGKGKISFFMLTAVVGAGARIFSNAQYNDYMAATNPSAKSMHYELANVSNKISMVSTGIAATIYLGSISTLLRLMVGD